MTVQATMEEQGMSTKNEKSGFDQAKADSFVGDEQDGAGHVERDRRAGQTQ